MHSRRRQCRRGAHTRAQDSTRSTHRVHMRCARITRSTRNADDSRSHISHTNHIALYPPGASHSDFMPSPTWAPRFLSHFRGALFSSQRATARIGLLRPSLAHGVEPVAWSGPFHGDPAPMAPCVSRCVGGSREFSGGSREWSTPSWCILMHHARAKPQSAGSF